jgi:endonuclease/exonuclease/phosphatase family metal-dependent hydrolase
MTFKVAHSLIIIVAVSLVFSCKAPSHSATSPQEVSTTRQSPSPTVPATASQETKPTPTLSPNTDFIEPPIGESFRVLSYNINWDSIFPDADPKNHSYREFEVIDEFERVLRSLRPDVLCLQEINHSRTSEELEEYISSVMDDNRTWKVINVRDNVLATHFNLIESGYELFTRGIRPSMAQAAGLVDLPDEKYGAQDLYVICAHFKSAGGVGDIKERTRQADVIMRQVRDFKSSGDHLDLPMNTPFIILGDLNVYDTDPAIHLQTLLSGDIQYENNYGPDVSPDWDGTSLSDVLPSHNTLGTYFYTWRADTSPFLPGALDRVIYADSVLQVAHSFILNTTLLTDDALISLGLERYDVLLEPDTGYFDHLPIVVDFYLAGE